MSNQIFFCMKAAFVCTKGEIGWNIISFKPGTFNFHNPVVFHFNLRERLSRFYVKTIRSNVVSVCNFINNLDIIRT